MRSLQFRITMTALLSTKYKAYPTYDLACPIIDHIDGVTHALRANEYFARREQYQWFLQKLGFPKIEIFDFRFAKRCPDRASLTTHSRIDFVYTVLSKRKLKYLVEKGVVGGWDDPRFSTVRGEHDIPGLIISSCSARYPVTRNDCQRPQRLYHRSGGVPNADAAGMGRHLDGEQKGH